MAILGGLSSDQRAPVYADGMQPAPHLSEAD